MARRLVAHLSSHQLDLCPHLIVPMQFPYHPTTEQSSVKLLTIDVQIDKSIVLKSIVFLGRRACNMLYLCWMSMSYTIRCNFPINLELNYPID